MLVANRDEYYQRESSAMHWWSDTQSSRNPGWLAGRDDVAGGTWLGIARSGAWAALTNFRESGSDRPDAKTRGELVTSFLREQQSPTQFIKDLQRSRQDYNGFNLLMSKPGQGIFCLTNRVNEADLRVESLQPGIYGLSNHLLNSDWPKVELAKASLAARIEHEEIRPSELVRALFDNTHPDDKQLPDTGVGLEKERLLSPMFIASEELQYGTRCTTAVTITHGGEIAVAEQTYPSGSLVEFEFTKQE